MTSTTYRAAAFLEAADRVGVDVAVGTDRPQVLASANPSGNLTLPFRDPPRALARIREFADRHPIDAVLATDDDGLLLGALAAEALGVEGNSVTAVRAARNKWATRRRLQAAGLRGPAFRLARVGDDPRPVGREVGYPCVIKPLTLSASRGVLRSDDEQQLASSFQRLAQLLHLPQIRTELGEDADNVLFESYLPGPEVAVEGLLSAGRLTVLAIFDKPDPLEGPVFEETIFVTPSGLPEERLERLERTVERAAVALGLHTGPVHAELRCSTREPTLLEIAPRTIGGHCSASLRFSGGRALEELVLAHALGRSITGMRRVERPAGVMMIPIPGRGNLAVVSGRHAAEQVPGVTGVRISIPVGGEVVPLPEGNRYLGFIFAEGGTTKEVIAALRTAHGRMTFEIRPGGGEIER